MEQRYQVVSLVIQDGESVVEVARRFEVSRLAVQRRVHKSGQWFADQFGRDVQQRHVRAPQHPGAK